ncbi:phosphomethylpyrimidine synthase ThiC [Streptomyces sp. FH025]|uniref:phosphomethylpyrimidine synthase ThiC n=1 Tax=Streptomyces sp. FH025 TaxID=2815937 RepID=UPI001A9E7D95|nr:phosphomethylpyrimidine synthase ThiC [Streptomyces sp. FH025]MBO1415142.1 phosphomethylpyrimidine synthase ThiC [Streptomyces sp. FH025]
MDAGAEARSYLLRNDAHDIDGVLLGRPHPPVLGVIIGVTPGETTPETEYDKAVRAVAQGAQTLTDVTTDGDPTLRRRVLESLNVSYGTVPTYEVFRRIRRDGWAARDAVLTVLEEQADEGVDFFTVHASGTPETARALGASDRVIPVTSRGGAMMVEVMDGPGGENPYLGCFDEVLELCRASGAALSLAGTFRPGSIADAMDAAHLAEIEVQAELVRRAQEKGVKVSVELVNHVPVHLIPAYCELGREKLHGAPFGALGPSPTDIAITYDHVAGAIGATTAALHGTSWVTCVTAGEHCRIPDAEDIVTAVKYFQIALHIAEVGRTGDLSRDAKLSRARNDNDWTAMAELAVHPADAQAMVERQGYHHGEACTMCRGTCPLVRGKAIRARQR